MARVWFPVREAFLFGEGNSIILAWRSPWTEEPGGLQSIGLLRVRHDWVTKPQDTSTWKRKLKVNQHCRLCCQYCFIRTSAFTSTQWVGKEDRGRGKGVFRVKRNFWHTGEQESIWCRRRWGCRQLSGVSVGVIPGVRRKRVGALSAPGWDLGWWGAVCCSPWEKLSSPFGRGARRSSTKMTQVPGLWQGHVFAECLNTMKVVKEFL